MNGGVVEVFNDVLSVTKARLFYSSASCDDALSSATLRVMQVNAHVDPASSVRVRLGVRIEHSSDGWNWRAKNAHPELHGKILEPGEATFVATERSPTSPALRFVRVAVRLAPVAAPTLSAIARHLRASLRLRILMTARGQSSSTTTYDVAEIQQGSSSVRELGDFDARLTSKLAASVHDAVVAGEPHVGRAVVRALSATDRKAVIAWCEQIARLPANQRRRLSVSWNTLANVAAAMAVRHAAPPEEK